MAEMLNTTEIANQSGWLPKKSAMLRFLDEPAVREWLGGKDTHPNYPADALPRFKWMLEQYGKGVKPKMLLLAVQGQASGSTEETSLVAVDAPAGELTRRAAEMTISDADALADRFADRIAETLARLNQESRPALEDRFLNREQAAELLACPPGAVGRRVRPVMANTWSFLDIQAFMVEAREKAHTKPQRVVRKAKEAHHED